MSEAMPEDRPDREAEARRGDGGKPPLAPDPRTKPPPPSPEHAGWRVHPAPDGRGKTPEKPPMFPWRPRRFFGILVLLLALNYLLVAVFAPAAPRPDISYSPYFLQQVRANNVKEISATGEQVKGKFRHKIDVPDDSSKDKVTNFKTQVPTFANTRQLSALLEQHNVQVNAHPPGDRSILQTLIFGFGPTLLLVGLFILLARRASQAAGGGGMLGSFGRSRARRVEPEEQHVTFEDVAGIDDAKQQLTEIVDYLKDPERFRKLGARIPRGVLLTGLPGTGKTLLARAVAGQAGVPFFSASAAEFIEAIVGIGASRVRDLFEQAKKEAPAIIFIDELDAIGRSRAGGMGFGGGHDEREQTLNQILTEMDGFDTQAGVIVLAATNRPEVLDPALLRPGRFDRRVAVSPPDLVGRREILEVHTRSVPLADDVDLEALASSTPGMVGADLANVVNEAALLAASRNHDAVTMADLNDALEKLVLGAERKLVMNRDDRKRIAHHEGGHAIVGMLTPGADPVRKVSIIPRGQALGVTFSAPDLDKFNYDETYLKGRLKVAMGGRSAEEEVYGDMTTGAENDIQQATDMARRMVGLWGMSDAVGPVAVLPTDHPPGFPGSDGTSEATQELVDSEVRRIVEEAHQDARRLLAENRDKLESLAEALLEKETLDAPEAYEAAGIERPQRTEETPVASAS
jgi:cell division protease FtsH